MATYTVVKGDSLWTIASKTLGSGTRWTEIADLNSISRSNPLIQPGQVLNLPGSSGGSGSTAKPTTTNKVTINYFGLQAGTDSTIFAAWSWSKSNTEKYQVKWYYDTGDSVWFIGNDSTVTEKQSTYGAPANAKRAKLIVKPISKTHRVNDKDVSYWNAEWSTAKIYDLRTSPPTAPPTPTVTIDDYKLTARVENLNVNGTSIQFQIVKDDKTIVNTGTAKIITSAASYSYTVTAGSEYKVRCRALRDNLQSPWSAYSSNAGTAPAASKGIKTIKALSETSVQLDWENVSNCDSYEVEYTTNKMYFDSGTSEVKKVTVESVVGHAEITGLESGREYFFRVRAVNGKGSSAWTATKSIVIGKAPSAPTTWSSTTTAVIGETITLYWVHNSEDGSNQTHSELEIYVNGVKENWTMDFPASEVEENKPLTKVINTSEYSVGTKFEWRVRTGGVTMEFGEWSIQRTVDIYAPATLELEATDVDGNHLETVTSFPFYIRGLAGPPEQRPTGYHVSIISNDTYETTDQIGNTTIIKSGSSIYSKHFDTTDPLTLVMSAGDVDLENNVNYTLKCTVSMNSGLTAEATVNFTVSWTDEEYQPNAEIGIDPDTISAFIRPYCEDEYGSLIENVTLSVYRREFNGDFTELATGIENISNTYITDPHPALDYARYRIVAISKDTGAVSYYDVPGYPVGVKSVIIQWDEAWSTFDITNEDAYEQPAWSGSMLKLPYNIDVSDNNSPDVSLVSYIGRSHPVSYYGTQLGTTASWNMVIEKSDTETLYALRRLSEWMGDVYVREPSGSGYWAHIIVSFSQKHREVTIPVTLDISRVEGGA